jgi:ATP-dependent Clp protease ATP-binding subunit ClpA
VTITDEALESAVRLSARYINDRFLPDKAIDLIDEASSKVRLTTYVQPAEIEKLDAEIAKLEHDKEQAIKKEAYELDHLTGIILSALHPETKVHIQGFETLPKSSEGSYDLVVSNIPFGNVRIFDPALSRSKDAARRQATQTLHNYFFVKGLDAVRNGGLVVYLTSRGVAESDANRPVREYLVRHANFISGIRLPDNLFNDDGIREVGTDLLVFQRNDNKQELSEDDKQTLMDMVQVMRQRRSRKQ